jgi:hypothetical protein
MWFNLLGFNLCWFGLVLYGNNFSVIALSWLTIHVYLVMEKKAEVTLIILVMLIGTIIDTSLLHLGVFTFDTSYIIPFWLIVLWGCFAATINHSLVFLSGSKTLQCLCGLVFAPLSYIGGASLSAVTLSYSLAMTYLLLALIWGPLMVLLFSLKTKIYNTRMSYA